MEWLKGDEVLRSPLSETQRSENCSNYKRASLSVVGS